VLPLPILGLTAYLKLKLRLQLKLKAVYKLKLGLQPKLKAAYKLKLKATFQLTDSSNLFKPKNTAIDEIAPF
jgi:hypothetical protein